MAIVKFLKPLKEIDYGKIEKEILALLKKKLFLPIIEILNFDKKIISNSLLSNLAFAIQHNKIYYQKGKFSGNFDSKVSKELFKLGARWKNDGYQIPYFKLPMEIKSSISLAEATLKDTLSKMDYTLSKLLPEKIAEELKLSGLFEKSIWTLNKTFEESVKGIRVAPQLTEKGVKTLAKEYENNVKITIKDLTDEQIIDLRAKIKDNFYAGNRYKAMVKTIQTSFKRVAHRANFIASQETKLISSKFKEIRYKEVGIEEYIWTSVTGTNPKHPVRKRHRELNGTVQRWDSPPRISEDNAKKTRYGHPGIDFNCRCTARPYILKTDIQFKK